MRYANYSIEYLENAIERAQRRLKKLEENPENLRPYQVDIRERARERINDLITAYTAKKLGARVIRSGGDNHSL